MVQSRPSEAEWRQRDVRRHTDYSQALIQSGGARNHPSLAAVVAGRSLVTGAQRLIARQGRQDPANAEEPPQCLDCFKADGEDDELQDQVAERACGGPEDAYACDVANSARLAINKELSVQLDRQGTARVE